MSLSPLLWQKNVLLSPFSTFKIGGPAKLFLSLKSKEDCHAALAYCQKHQIPFYILGKGSNTLFDDRGFDGAVLLNELNHFERYENVLYGGSGLSFPWLGFQSAKCGLSGLEYAAGVPGSLGGAIFMNAGAMGQDIGEVILEVEFLSKEGYSYLFSKEELLFKYRWSSFQLTKGIILSAKLKLKPLEQAREIQKEHLQKRQASQPLKEPSCGCIFRNLVHISAGALIDELGLKGLEIGGARVSQVHANFIVNTGNATAQDVLSLVELIEKKAFEKRGLKLQKELHYLPYQKENL
jgi:UDP-N-acetylmuramate dehydrogenase